MAAPARHWLVVADDVRPEDLEALAVSRVPQVFRTAQRTLAWDGVQLVGPQPVPAEIAGDVPGWASAVVEMTVAADRGPAVPRELRAPGGLLAAFADGEPAGLERESLELLMAFARRLGGSVLTSTRILVEPHDSADLLVFSEVWLDPAAIEVVLGPHVPGLAFEDHGPAHTPLDAVVGQSDLDEGERRWLHAEADAFDEHSVTNAEPAESYGVVGRAPGGRFSVVVESVPMYPLVVSVQDWALGRPVFLYEVRYYPDLDGDPAAGAPIVEDSARALLAALGGPARALICDDDGFLVEL